MGVHDTIVTLLKRERISVLGEVFVSRDQRFLAAHGIIDLGKPRAIVSLHTLEKFRIRTMWGRKVFILRADLIPAVRL